MDFEKTTTFMARIWDDEIVPVLTDYIRIPNKSPAFDPDWEKHGHMEKVVNLFSGWAQSKLAKLPGSSLEVVRLPGRTPLIFIEVPGTAPGAHFFFLGPPQTHRQKWVGGGGAAA